ncbi:uncharacterized protein F5Z01DRAFT_749575 [Emericellopsis atlantica]|uniref:Uncharacterized protein n=1 Tax=Emericellopsis atlantica TaxID=2614577 RepID=A0A9P7ZNQ7_9HYPO|nr:uncharacterized protein F5Z01DRAFT_749575 [Emericellopsis atlantica]KAG9255400.1 hypothetical protein F5Z01DRAFT_749575 [Emericellopsis atlantica]
MSPVISPNNTNTFKRRDGEVPEEDLHEDEDKDNEFPGKVSSSAELGSCHATYCADYMYMYRIHWTKSLALRYRYTVYACANSLGSITLIGYNYCSILAPLLTGILPR